MDVTLSSGAPLASGAQQSQVNFTQIRDAYQRNSNWWTVFACFDVKDCPPTAAGISARTRLPRVEVDEALSGLCVLGCLRKNGERYETLPGADFLHFDYEHTSHAEILDRHGLVSQQMLNELPEATKVAFDHRCFAANEQVLKELYTDLRAAFMKAFAKAQTNQSNNDRIFKMTFTAVDVLSKTRPQENS